MRLYYVSSIRHNVRHFFKKLLNKEHTFDISKKGSFIKKEQSSLNKDFVADSWSGQEVISIFEGEWASRIPGFHSGSVPAFDDDRIKWLEKQCGGFSGKSILELGPMEGGHTYMLWKGGASQIVSIEGNKRSFLKCLITKELLGYSAKFRLGDFARYLETTNDKYDFVLASGVLYHMADPVRLLESIPRVTNRIGIWTHYFDEKVILSTKYLKRRFDIPGQQITWKGRTIIGYRQKYRNEPNLLSFVGGNLPYSTWIRKDDIIGILESLGFSVVIGNDDLHGKNGPSMLLYASAK
jgi:SAM-dependent methyltransferase